MEQDRWQVNYPSGLIRYIDLFRDKYFQYPSFDKALDQYIKMHKKSSGNRILSLGSGTGRHEVELAKLGYNITAIERNKESVEIAMSFAKKSGVFINFLECDFLELDKLNETLNQFEKFDAVLLLLVPISTLDYSIALENVKKWVKKGGVFITDIFGYENDINVESPFLESNIEVAEDMSGDFVVRLNYYEYNGFLVNWTAIYLYKDALGKLQMERDHDCLDVIPEIELDSPLVYDKASYEVLPKHKLIEVEKFINPPHMIDYFIGWRKVSE